MAAITPRVLFSSSAGANSFLSEMLPFTDVSYFRLLPKTIWTHWFAQGAVFQTLKKLIRHIEAKTDPLVILCCRVGEGVLFKPILERRSDIQEVTLSKFFLIAKLKGLPESLSGSAEPSLKRSYSDNLENFPEGPSVEAIQSNEHFLSRSRLSAGATLASKTVPLLQLGKLKDKEEESERPIEKLPSYDEIPRSRSSSSRRSSLDLYKATVRSSSHSCRLSPPEQKDKEMDLENVASASVRFSPLETAHYPETFQKVLDYISRGLHTKQSFLEITLYSVDCLFFVQLLNELCKNYIIEASLKPNYVIHIELKRELDIPKAREQIQRQKDQIMKDLLIADPETKETPPTPRSPKTNPFALLDTCSSFLECSSSPRNAFFSASSALARLNHSDASEVSKHKICSLATSYLSYKLQYEPPLEEKCQWNHLWEEVERCLPAHSILSSKSHRKKIKKLAILRADTEKTFFPLQPIDILDELNKIDWFQALRRTLFADAPLASIWINGRPLEMQIVGEQPESTEEIYYYSLIKSLTEHLGEMDLNVSSFVSSLLTTKEGTEFFHKKPEELKLILLLKASSFSFFGKARIALQKIVSPLLEKGYEVKFIKPQQMHTAEFFLTKEGDFVVIRTAQFPLIKDHEEKAEFVLKWIVSFQQGQWSCALKIPVIDVAPNSSFEEHKLIYKTFSAYQRGESSEKPRRKKGLALNLHT